MKKTVLGLLMFVMFIFPIKTFASSFDCEYTYSSTVVTVHYKYGSKVTYDVEYRNSNRNNEVEAVNINNNNLVDTKGNMSCPRVSVSRKEANGKNRYKITLNVDSNGDYSGTMLNKKDDGSEKINYSSGNIACVYYAGKNNEYSLLWNGAGVEVNLTGKTYTSVGVNKIDIVVDGLNSSHFKNGSCPNVYEDFIKKQGVYRFIVSANPIVTDNELMTDPDAAEDVYDGSLSDPDINYDSSYSSPSLNYDNLCYEEGVMKASKIIGYVVLVAKWLAPLIIIVLGMVDFGKAVTSSDEKEIGKAFASLIRRLVAGVIIFLIPTIVLALLDLIHVTKGLENTTFGPCTKCILNVNKCGITGAGRQ